MARLGGQRGVSRARERERLRFAASQVELPHHADICVVGGGAAGLVCAIVAAERGARVVVLERDLECGRSILATGNGRCNFSNSSLDCGQYNDPEFVRLVVGADWLGDVLSFFRESGLMWVEESEGRLYPFSRQAASVRNVLVSRARRSGVILACARGVRDITRAEDGFVVGFASPLDDDETLFIRATHVVLATGGPSDGQLDVGLRTHPARPILCPIACAGPALKALDGRRAYVRAELRRGAQTIVLSRGEMLFRPYGLSGIVMFDLSRYAEPGDVIVLDLLPDISLSDAQRRARFTADGILDPVVVQALRGVASHNQNVVSLAKNLCYTVHGPAETSRAQVTRGGLVTAQFDPLTLEAHGIKGFFACGEALDVDGPCGGYNLAWAWKSGMVAGAAAAGRGRA